MTDTLNGRSRPAETFRLLLIVILFVMTRLLIVPLSPFASDVGIYAQYAREQQRAAERGVSFYDVHAQAPREEIERARGALVGTQDEYREVEYPPLALAFMRLPLLWLHFTGDYAQAYRIGMVVIDACLFALVLLARPFSRERGQTVRLLTYLGSTVVLWNLLYDRLDLVQALLVLLVLLLLVSRLHWIWSFAVLAVAINFKLIPVVLAPVCILASWPVQQPLALSRPRTWLALGIRLGLLLALIVGCFLPFYVRDGSRSLSFLSYHRARGIEFESLYGSVLMTLQAIGQPLAVDNSYGSVNLSSAVSPFLIALSPWLTAVLLLGATALLLVHCRRLAEDNSGVPGERLAHLDPRATAGYVLLFLMLFIAGNKVFSPQYLLWLAPLVALSPIPGRSGRLFLGGFFLLCVLTAVVFPFLFSSDLLERVSPEGAPLAYTLRTPTLRLAAVLGLRNLLFCLLTVALGLSLYRRGRAPVSGSVTA